MEMGKRMIEENKSLLSLSVLTQIFRISWETWGFEFSLIVRLSSSNSGTTTCYQPSSEAPDVEHAFHNGVNDPYVNCYICSTFIPTVGDRMIFADAESNLLSSFFQ
jgi:hypothetical protein